MVTGAMPLRIGQVLSPLSLQKTGGAFTLSSEVDFGSSFGLKSSYFKSRNANPAASGVVRLGSTESVSFRNNANSSDLALTTDASDNLVFNGHVITGSGGLALNSANLFVGNASNIATGVAVTGDVTISNAGVTAVGANKITNAQLAQVAANSFKGNNTGSPANVIDMTVAQATAALNLFTSSLQGLAPASGGGTTNFLRADGTWAAPAGSGTVTSVTFTGDGTVLSSTPSSAVTTSGTVTGTLKTQTKNTVLAGPTFGSAANPTFRALQAADFVAPTIQKFASGTGTYTTPVSPAPLYLRVRMVGGGGGGGGSGSGSTGELAVAVLLQLLEVLFVSRCRRWRSW